MKGLEGVSDSDFHGWTVPRYGADAKESGGAGVANLAVRGPRNIYMRGREKTEHTDVVTQLFQREQVIRKAGPG